MLSILRRPAAVVGVVLLWLVQGQGAGKDDGPATTCFRTVQKRCHAVRENHKEIVSASNSHCFTCDCHRQGWLFCVGKCPSDCISLGKCPNTKLWCNIALWDTMKSTKLNAGHRQAEENAESTQKVPDPTGMIRDSVPKNTPLRSISTTLIDRNHNKEKEKKYRNLRASAAQ